MIRLPNTFGGVVAMMLRMLLGALFVYSGWQKAQDPIGFLNSVRSFHILHDPYAAWLAMGLPYLEIAAGAALVTGLLVDGGLAVIAGMLAVFLWAIVYSWQRGLDIDCGCFGREAQGVSYWERILRDTGMLAVAISLLLHRTIVRHRSKPRILSAIQ